MMGVTALVNNFNVEAYLSLGWEIRAEMVDEWGRPAMIMEWNLDDEPQKPEGIREDILCRTDAWDC